MLLLGVTSNGLKVKFGGPDRMSANTLIINLMCLSNIIHEVNRELNDDRSVEVKVDTFKEGSFIIHLLIHSGLLNNIGNLFTETNLTSAADIVTIISGLYSVTKFFAGKEKTVVERNDNSTMIKNTKGDVTYVDNRVFDIYQNNRVIKDEISREFESLENDGAITDFALLDSDDKPLISIPKNVFPTLSGADDDIVLPDERVITKPALLSILALSFEKNIKWSFYYEGNRIAAKIKDDEFVRMIDSGEKFAKGDALEAEIEIKQRYDESVKTFVNKSYVVNKINKHIPGHEQGRFSF